MILLTELARAGVHRGARIEALLNEIKTQVRGYEDTWADYERERGQGNNSGVGRREIPGLNFAYAGWLAMAVDRRLDRLLNVGGEGPGPPVGADVTLDAALRADVASCVQVITEHSKRLKERGL